MSTIFTNSKYVGECVIWTQLQKVPSTYISMSILFIWNRHYRALMWCELWLYFTCYWIIILESADEMIFQFSCFEYFVFYITKLTINIMSDSQFYSKMVVKSNCLFKKFSETKKPKVSTCFYLLYLSIWNILY